MLTTITHRAMACEFVVMLPPSDAPLIDAAFAALECLDEIEAELTVYQPGSEISKINANAENEWVPVSASTFGLIEQSQLWSQRTDGAFDITAGPLIRSWGFLSRQGRKPNGQEIQDALQKVGHDHLKLRRDDSSVHFERPGMEINLGAIGKGYALDRLAATLTEAGLKNFLIHGGGSSVLARGDQDNLAETRNGWAVGIAHPTKPNQRLAGIRLIDAALSTSGSGKQFFHHRGRRYGHVIDPRTGYPAGELLSLTVVAESATDAEACSTAYFLSPLANLKADSDAGELPAKMLATIAEKRQDAVKVIALSEFDWIDPPKAD
ncbi:FAD:protein FMN transferase [Stieleria sp. JC731]|uniref:FAD:protein FMN transferase n=1 Tax=Pirellulaceae TaxID=2691357 RepID=UPI001E4DD702|nr:FAD:protein FMN transferase [Stieleria sp. JC731]MCC9602709.1 FAD:protein FMN transferase [Stieleria sp. JC731]